VSSSLFRVFQRIQLFVVPADIAISAAVTAGSTTTVTDTVNLAGGASRGDNLFEFLWLALFSGVGSLYSRRVIEGGDNATTGVLTFAPATALAPDLYQVWTVDPALVVAAIDTALRRMEFIERIPLTVVTDQWIYPLATDAAWVTRRGQFLGIEWQDPHGTPLLPPRPVQGWQVTQDRLAFTLNLGRPYTLGQDTVLLVTLRSYLDLDGTPLPTNTQSTANAAWVTTAPLDWLAAETALVLLEQPVTRRLLATRQAEYEQALREAHGIAERYRRDHQPDVPRRMFGRTARGYDPVRQIV
jgi:hypothetical protein